MGFAICTVTQMQIMTVCAIIIQMRMVMVSVTTAMTMGDQCSQSTTTMQAMAQVHTMADTDIMAAATAAEVGITEGIAKYLDKAKRTNFARNNWPGFDKEDKMQNTMNHLFNLMLGWEGAIVLRIQ